MLSKTFRTRLSEKLADAKESNRNASRGKHPGGPKKYSTSRAYRFALVRARKDRNVDRSSKGMFHSVADLVSGTRRREPGCPL